VEPDRTEYGPRRADVVPGSGAGRVRCRQVGGTITQVGGTITMAGRGGIRERWMDCVACGAALEDDDRLCSDVCLALAEAERRENVQRYRRLSVDACAERAELQRRNGLLNAAILHRPGSARRRLGASQVPPTVGPEPVPGAAAVMADTAPFPAPGAATPATPATSATPATEGPVAS
jgi:predicted nucleic acid-binding Zn ribbon protein